MTFKERLIIGLEREGWSRDHTDRSRYVAFTKPGTPGKVFVGTNGALRVGRNASESHSIGDPGNQNSVYKRLLAHTDEENIVDTLTA